MTKEKYLRFYIAAISTFALASAIVTTVLEHLATKPYQITLRETASLAIASFMYALREILHD